MKEKTGRVLLIEDNLGDARLLAEVLSDVPGKPFELVHANLVSSALARLGEEHFEAILLDLSLPDGQGFDVLRLLLEVAPSIPILVLTGLNDEQMALNALSAGAQDYLIKGSHGGDFISRAVRYAIQRKELQERTRALRDIDQAITSDSGCPGNFRCVTRQDRRIVPVFSRLCSEAQPGQRRIGDSAAPNRMHRAELETYDWKPLSAAARPNMPIALARHNQPNRAATWDEAVALPLKLKERTWGYLCFFSKKEREFSVEELEFLSALAAQVAVAIHNAELYAGTVALAETCADPIK